MVTTNRYSKMLAVLACVVSGAFGISVPDQTYAMGDKTAVTRSFEDIKRPDDWVGVHGYVAQGDRKPLARNHLRLYRVSEHSSVPEEIAAKVRLVRLLLDALGKPPVFPDLSDITELARSHGAGPQTLFEQGAVANKTVQPNKVLIIGSGTSQLALVLLRVAQDEPDAAVNVELFCQKESSDKLILVSKLGPVRPNKMIEIKETLCATRFD